MIREKKKSSNRRVSESSSRHGCPLCKSFGEPLWGVESYAEKEVRMYALTVNDIDAQTYARISSIAFEEECSLSQALHRLISIALERYPLKRKSSFARFAGRWTAEEAVAFNELTQRTVDEEDWK